MGAPQQSWLRSDPSKTSTTLPFCTSLSSSTSPERGRAGIDSTRYATGDQGQMRWHRGRGSRDKAEHGYTVMDMPCASVDPWAFCQGRWLCSSQSTVPPQL